MEFGIFSQMHCPPWDDEHSRFMRELEISELCDAVGFKYDWSPEHHFLQYYSHQPAPEVYLSWVAARTKQIHIGTAITNITAAVMFVIAVPMWMRFVRAATHERYTSGAG